MAADVLVPSVARWSAATLLTMQNESVIVFQDEDSLCCVNDERMVENTKEKNYTS